MANEVISRRALLPRLAAGATALLAGNSILLATPAEAEDRDFQATTGQCNFRRGQTFVYDCFLPASSSGGSTAKEFSLVLRTPEGRVILTHRFVLRPGTGTQIRVAFLQDGGIAVNGNRLPGVVVYLVVIAIIAILIGLLLPAVQKVRATSTLLVPGRNAGEMNVEYIIPFVER